MSIRSLLRAIYVWLNAPLRTPTPPSFEEFSDPEFGLCRFCSMTDSWTARVAIVGQDVVMVRGRSKRPTSGQVALWHELRPRAQVLLAAAIQSLPDPLPGVVADLRDAELEEVRFNDDGNVELFLSTEVDGPGGYTMCPIVTFRGWEIVDSGWTV
jgi:hypothetical protein